MKKYLSNLLPIIPVAFILGSVMFSHSCANTTTPPSGGPKDTIPPVITRIKPAAGSINVPTHKTKLELTFDEYVVVKDPKSLYLSPPLEKVPKFKIQNKSVVVYFESDLDSNKTYTLDVTNAIADNNEGNMFPGYTLVFSTGDRIDSMMVTGTVQDCNTLQPIKGATVMLYKDQADSAVFLKRPDAAMKTDDWGYFCLRNIQDTVYRMYALIDENNNNKYDPETEKIAFLDSLVQPVMKVNDTLPELAKYDMKDILCGVIVLKGLCGIVVGLKTLQHRLCRVIGSGVELLAAAVTDTCNLGCLISNVVGCATSANSTSAHTLNDLFIGNLDAEYSVDLHAHRVECLCLRYRTGEAVQNKTARAFV